MTIEATLDRLATNIALLAGVVATLAESVNGTYQGKPIYADTVGEPPKAPAAKTRKATPAAAASESAPAPVASLASTSTEVGGSAQLAAQTPAAATTAKEPTLDDVRAALVALQTRKGTKAPAQTILEKYSPTKVTGGLPKEKYKAVIDECAAA